jgi:hypothetical protein
MPTSSKSFAIALVLIALIASSTSAATIYYSLDLNTPGHFTVYADASIGDNFGIAAYGFQLKATGGQITSEDNWSPWGVIRTNFSYLGFADNRVPLSDASTVPDASTATTVFTFSGSQQIATGNTANFIYGFGQSASSFAALYGANYSAGFSAGLDPTDDQLWNAHLRLASGTYTGTLRFDATSANNVGNVWATNDRTRFAPAAQIVGNGCLECGPQVSSKLLNNVNASDPGSVSYTFTAINQPDSWSNFHFDSYLPDPGASGSGPVNAATFDPNTQLFSWNTVGSPLGTYKWLVSATNFWGTGTGSVTVHITAVPEPAILSLIGLAVLGGISLFRHRGIQ